MTIISQTASEAPFHAMVKPRGAVCNLDCAYCYFLKKEELFPGSTFRMDSATLETFTRNYIAGQPTNTVVFSWHGGEPTLAGMDFFREALKWQEKYARRGMIIENTIQTNAVLIDSDWAEFFAAHNFLVGVSIDGPAEVHDTYRVDKGGKPTFSRVVEGIRRLQEAGVTPNFLCALNNASEGQGIRIYEFLRDDLGAKFVQFIPVVEPSSDSPGSTVTPWSISATGYGNFLKEVFEQWYQQDVGKVFVQMFEVALASWVGAPKGLCVFEETCGRAIAVEHNGDTFSCDHFVDPEYRLGNVAFISLQSMVDSAQQKEFGEKKRSSLPTYCQQCPVLSACNGGCPKDRFILTPEGEKGLNYLCAGYRDFFLSIDQPLRELSADLGLEKVALRRREWSSVPS